MFSVVTAVAEFVGGGIYPYFRIDVIRLFPNVDGFGFVTRAAEVLFVIATFYYTVNTFLVMKKEGCSKFFQSTWNQIDIITVILSIIAIALYITRALLTTKITRTFNESGGNDYIRLTYTNTINQYYTYIIAFNVFTATLKFCRLLSFHRAFLQVRLIMSCEIFDPVGRPQVTLLPNMSVCPSVYVLALSKINKTDNFFNLKWPLLLEKLWYLLSGSLMTSVLFLLGRCNHSTLFQWLSCVQRGVLDRVHVLHGLLLLHG